MKWNIKSLILLCCLTSKLVIDTHYKTQASTQENNNKKNPRRFKRKQVIKKE